MIAALSVWCTTFIVYYIRHLLFSEDDASYFDDSASRTASFRVDSPRRRTLAQRCFCRTKKCHRMGNLSSLGRMTLGLATFLYPAACTNTLRMLDCTPATFSSILALQSLDWGSRSDKSIAELYANNFQSSSTGGALQQNAVTLYVLRMDPYYVCWAGRCVCIYLLLCNCTHHSYTALIK
jgi:hypothetical protein